MYDVITQTFLRKTDNQTQTKTMYRWACVVTASNFVRALCSYNFWERSSFCRGHTVRSFTKRWSRSLNKCG